jgi:chaperonin GroES
MVIMAKAKNTDSTTSEPQVNIGIRPLMGYLLIKPDAAESKTASGLYLPEGSQERPAQGVVLSTGPDLIIEGKVIPPPVAVGDRVVYKKWGGDEIKYKGEDYKLVKFEDLMAVLVD